jgi:hypothetical protein
VIATQIFRLKDYELACSAKASDSGKFEPALVISRQRWPSRPRTIAVRRGGYPTAEVAIESAHAQGIEWVANYG